jgi:glycosyltransferase involved in cell wall biosynthesis
MATELRVLLVTTWNTPCGIAEHAAYLKEAVEAADPAIQISPSPEALDPGVIIHAMASAPPDVVHLNYQAALHSRWTPERIALLRKGFKVLVTYHDTGVPNSDQCKAICAAADAVVVHEPYTDLPPEKVRYWRMGVPGWTGAYEFDTDSKRRPLLGTIGFPFPWKHYEELAKVTAVCGWELLIIAPGATPEQEQTWKQLNPRTSVCPTFLPRHLAVSWLAGCDATAFAYGGCNTGQSASILQGIAARKPVLAFRTCRQFRALYHDWLGREAIAWCEDFEGLRFLLSHVVPIGRVDPGIVALAEQDSWEKLGAKYAALYRELANGDV